MADDEDCECCDSPCRWWYDGFATPRGPDGVNVTGTAPGSNDDFYAFTPGDWSTGSGLLTALTTDSPLYLNAGGNVTQRNLLAYDIKFPNVGDHFDFLLPDHVYRIVRTGSATFDRYYDGVLVPEATTDPILASSDTLARDGYRLFNSPGWDGLVASIGGTPPSDTIIVFYQDGIIANYLLNADNTATLGQYGIQATAGVSITAIESLVVANDYSHSGFHGDTICPEGGTCDSDPNGCYDVIPTCRWNCWDGAWVDEMTLTVSGFVDVMRTVSGCGGSPVSIPLSDINGDYVLSRVEGQCATWLIGDDDVVCPCDSAPPYRNARRNFSVEMINVVWNTCTGEHKVVFGVFMSDWNPTAGWPDLDVTGTSRLAWSSDVMDIDDACAFLTSGGTLELWPVQQEFFSASADWTTVCDGNPHLTITDDFIRTGLCGIVGDGSPITMSLAA